MNDRISVSCEVSIGRDAESEVRNRKFGTFSSKDEFIGFVLSKALEVWSTYETQKANEAREFEQWKRAQKAKAAREANKRSSELYEKSETKVIEDAGLARKKVEEIMSNDKYTESWKPYAIMKEVCGVDLVDQPDLVGAMSGNCPPYLDAETIEAYVQQVKSKRPDPVNNNGVFRRAK